MGAENGDARLQRLSVAVIGAGAAGIVTARELLREGHSVTVFEQTDGIGGIWRYSGAVEEDDLLGRDPARRKIHSSMYEGLRTNLPREIMSFADFPFTPEAMGKRSQDPRRYPGHREVLAFLEAYADNFGVLPLIRYSRLVLRVDPVTPDSSQLANGHVNGVHSERSSDSTPRWAVTTVPWVEGSTSQEAAQNLEGRCCEEFNAVVSCVGNYHEPNLPPVRGMEDFPGRQLHCHNYRGAEMFEGQTVLVVGASFSGEEIARRIADTARHVFQSARSWPWGAATADPVPQGRPNIRRTAMLTRLLPDGRAELADGEVVGPLDAVVYCTGYNYVYPWAEHLGLVTTDDMRVAPLWQHIFPPSVAPRIAFVGLLWKSLRNIEFQLQATLVARALSGRVALPSPSEMARQIEEFYSLMEERGVPVRYTHCQSDNMPINQWEYMDEIAALAGPDVPKADSWRRELHEALLHDLFGRPDTFRDDLPEGQEDVYCEAERACAQLLETFERRRAAGEVVRVPWGTK